MVVHGRNEGGLIYLFGALSMYAGSRFAEFIVIDLPGMPAVLAVIATGIRYLSLAIVALASFLVVFEIRSNRSQNLRSILGPDKQGAWRPRDAHSSYTAPTRKWFSLRNVLMGTCFAYCVAFPEALIGVISGAFVGWIAWAIARRYEP